jgi:predicted RNA-binding Zn ribbon-like protein
MKPETVVRLANLTAARKPGREPTTHPNPLADPRAAADALGLGSIEARDLDALRELHHIVVALVDRLIAGVSIESQAARLNALVRSSVARVRLDSRDGQQLRERLDWSDPTPAAAMARRVIAELGELTPQRLRRCGRAQCNLVFYDTTRSNTRRWHAESPCGLRERQERHRATASPR